MEQFQAKVLFISWTALSMGLLPRLEAHGKHTTPLASAPVEAPTTLDQPAGDDAQPEKLDAIAAAYEKEIEPLLRRACGDCHSDKVRYPWYYGVPGIRSYIDADRAEALDHINISKGFPFISHSAPVQDLLAIAKSLEEDSMPPQRYQLLHRDAQLTPAEKAKILTWTHDGEKLLRAAERP